MHTILNKFMNYYSKINNNLTNADKFQQIEIKYIQILTNLNQMHLKLKQY
jgi:hypothetical protein